MGLTCLTDVFSPSKTCETRTDITATKALVLSVPGTTFADATEFATESVWLTKIASGNLYPIIDMEDTEVQDGENIFQETSYQVRTKLLDGKRSAKLTVKLPLDQHQIAYEYLNGRSWEAFFVDIFGNIQGTYNSDGTIRGFTLAYFNVDRQNTPNASDSAVATMLDYDMVDIYEWDKSGVYLNPTSADDPWFPQRLDSVLKVVTTSTAIAANAFTTSVAYVNNAKPLPAGTTNSEVISGLLIGNFEVIDQNGDVITPDSVTENPAGSGDYDIDCTAETITSGSVQVKPTTVALYKSEVEVLS